MYFKIYHKRSRQLLQTFNEQTIVDFCTKNIENLSTFYFSIGNEKELMEWETFAKKNEKLFAKKQEERSTVATPEEYEALVTELPKKRVKIPWILIFSLSIVVAVFAAYRSGIIFSQKHVAQKVEHSVKMPSQGMTKRAVRPEDTSFVAKMPTQKELQAVWKKESSPKIKELTPLLIKPVMDKLLPDLKRCFDDRVAAGDTDLHGTFNMKIQVSGDGVVRGVLLTNERYKMTLFGDCVISALKEKKFPMFKAKEQVFTYYFSL